MIERGYMWRVGTVAVLLLGVWGGLAARLVQLHLGENESLKTSVRNLHAIRQNLHVERGRILDRGGNPLALDLRLRNILVTPSLIVSNNQVRLVSEQLAQVLDLPLSQVMDRVNRPRRHYEVILPGAPEELAERVEQLGLQGVRFEYVNVRQYPQNELACHVIGFVNVEGDGSAGIELRWDSLLKGRQGFRLGSKDGRRAPVYTLRSLEVAPRDGANVHLTLDQNIQYFTERALDAALATYNAEVAWAIVQEVRTGAILAMASRPAYDLNHFRSAGLHERTNLAIGVNFEPGSVFKAGVIAAAINEGVVATNHVFDCENGLWFHGGRSLRDYRPHGELDVTGIIRKSSNIGTAKIALLLDQQVLFRYLRDFGVGSRTGIELPGEEIGILAPPSQWSGISVSRIAMGHEVAVTALQMLNMLCTIGNDGFRMRPYIVQRVVDADGTVLHETRPEAVSRPITERTAALMRNMLAEATREGGTGTRGAIPGYNVAGKTGTAQKVLEGGGYAQRENIATFMGLLPAERPEIGIIVVLDNPQPRRTGGATAAPVFAEIAAPTVRYLDIPPVGAAERAYYHRLIRELP